MKNLSMMLAGVSVSVVQALVTAPAIGRQAHPPYTPADAAPSPGGEASKTADDIGPAIVVSGPRICGFTAPTSTTVIGSDLIKVRAPGFSPTLSNSINLNRRPPIVYVNISTKYDILSDGSQKIELFGVANDLFDKPPYMVDLTLSAGSSTISPDGQIELGNI